MRPYIELLQNSNQSLQNDTPPFTGGVEIGDFLRCPLLQGIRRAVALVRLSPRSGDKARMPTQWVLAQWQVPAPREGGACGLSSPDRQRG